MTSNLEQKQLRFNCEHKPLNITLKAQRLLLVFCLENTPNPSENNRNVGNRSEEKTELAIRA